LDVRSLTFNIADISRGRHERAISIIQLQTKMMSFYHHPFIQIESMGGKPLHAGVQMKLIAVFFLRILD
jgi:hypothetical protein